MSSRPTETSREMAEAERRAAVKGSSASDFTGPQSSAPISAGTNDADGNWKPYGRVGITPIGQFRLRGK
jgi:hypothetical protein